MDRIIIVLCILGLVHLFQVFVGFSAVKDGVVISKSEFKRFILIPLYIFFWWLMGSDFFSEFIERYKKLVD